ncbi:MAG: universal stress protein [Verrucomicrobia bacterium]|nr:universal stress protein [Cytophagales bacterium]
MKTILVPTDFSENAIPAMKTAILAAQKADLLLVFLHITDVLNNQEDKHKVFSLAESKLKDVVYQLYGILNLLPDDTKHKYLIMSSFLIHETIAQTAEEHKIDLVMMGTHGSTGLERVLLGSNTVGTIEKSACPVLAIPTGYDFKGFRKLGYATDLVKLDKEMAQIVDFAKIFGAAIEIFHIFPVYPQNVEIDKIDNHAFTENLQQTFNYPHINLHFVHTAKENETAAGVELFIKCYKPDVVAMFMRERSWFDKIFDHSKTEALVFHATIPLLALKSIAD